MIDIGFLRNIDFTNSDNLLFFSIVLFLVIIIIVVFLFVIGGILKSFIGLFKFEKKSVVQGKAIYDEALAQGAQAQPVLDVQPKKHRKFLEWFQPFFTKKKKKKDKESGNFKKTEADKEKERISKQLEQFKKETSMEKGGAPESNMPFTGGSKEEGGNGEIKIPVAKKFAPQSPDSAASPTAPESAASHGIKLSGLKDKKGQITSGGQAQANVSESDRMELLKGKEVKIVKGQNVHAGDIVGPVAGHNVQEGQGEFFEKPEFMEDKLGAGSLAKKGSEIRGGEGSILFGNKKEVSRDELKEKLGKDSAVWKASKDTGLGFSSMEREHIEEIFPQSMGGNISRSDLKSIVKKIDQKRAANMNPAKKEVLRKGSNFLKKIGGIK